MKSSNEMFKELVAADIIDFGGGCGTYSYSAGVPYGETFAKCYSGVKTIDSFDELKDLYNLWVQSGRNRSGVIAWLSKKHGYLPLYFYLERYQELGKFDFSTLNLPPNPNDDYYRKMAEEMLKG